jgi:hypothetical protein
MRSKLVLAALLSLCIGLSASAQSDEMEPRRNMLGPNVIAFAPIQFSENGVAGLGLSYERALDEYDVISFYVPAMAVLNTSSSTDAFGNTNHNSNPMFYLMPGVKIYPTGGFGLAKYAIGPSLVVAGGTGTDTKHIYNSYNETSYSRFLLGMMVNQSLNINPTPHLYIGGEFGFGFTYFNKQNGENTNTKGLVQFSFKVGYRF